MTTALAARRWSFISSVAVRNAKDAVRRALITRDVTKEAISKVSTAKPAKEAADMAATEMVARTR
jgi:hypothetical protein